MKIFWEILWTRFSLVTSLTERIGDEAIFHRIDNSRILRLWPTYFFAMQSPKQDFYHFLLVVFLKILWGSPTWEKIPYFPVSFGGRASLISSRISMFPKAPTFLYVLHLSPKWNTFSPQTSISPHNLINLPFCPKSFLNFPNHIKNSSIFD